MPLDAVLKQMFSRYWRAFRRSGSAGRAVPAERISSVGAAELPTSYGRSRVTAMVVDPYHLHVYWEATPADVREAQRTAAASRGAAAPVWVLRFYDVTRLDYDGSNAHGHFDVDIDLDANSWYVDLWEPDKEYVVELGCHAVGRFAAVARSSPVHVPRAATPAPEPPVWTTLTSEGGRTACVVTEPPPLGLVAAGSDSASSSGTAPPYPLPASESGPATLRSSRAPVQAPAASAADAWKPAGTWQGPAAAAASAPGVSTAIWPADSTDLEGCERVSSPAAPLRIESHRAPHGVARSRSLSLADSTRQSGGTWLGSLKPKPE